MQLEQLLLAHPSGLRKADIARRLGVHRATAARYITDLTSLTPVAEDDDGRVVIDRDKYLSHIRLTIHESLALYLACRLMADRTDRFNPHAASALRKLGQSLQAFSPAIAPHIIAEAEKLEDSRARRDPVYLPVLETLTRGWSEGRIVSLVHHSVHRDAEDTYRFAVFLIVPYAVGQTVQVIGQCIDESHLRTLRVDRIRQATLTADRYDNPDDAMVRRMLENAWGIWYSDSPPIEVVLRFSPAVAHRVRETVWHASQRIRDVDEGFLEWRAHIAEPREMVPWIRGWGADVEVLAPEELRKKLMEEVQRMADIYSDRK
ncbi:MAG TPA: WYL domain-containing transcriptional regulator [Terriglobales bacterium]|nr:WYL domain-containing transcriptional regulator [Terriglobales bacterium]